MAAISFGVSLVDGVAMLLAVSLAGVQWPDSVFPAAIGMLLLGQVGLHRGRLTLRASDDVAPVLARSSVALILTAPLVDAASLEWIAIAAITSWVLILTGRSAAYRTLIAARRRGMGVSDVLVVGAGTIGTQIVRTLRHHKEFGLNPVGFVDQIPHHADLPVLGPPEALPDLLERHSVRHVIVAFGQAREHEMVSIVRQCAHMPLELYTLPRFFELGHVAEARSTEDLWGFPLLRLRSGGLMQRAWRIKRAFDLVVATMLLVLFSPVMAVCTLAVKLSSRGPVLFRQERVRQFGGTMEILKFRSMTVNDDSDITWNVEGDQRVTWVGRILRPTHLDELPQLWNVLRGDMSIVGPRPERPAFVEQFASEIAGYGDRHRYPVGLTGWAQVHGLWGDTSIADRARLDNRYIERWSLWTDIVILLRTLPTLLGRRSG